jgi:hypothetical protein
VGFRARPYRSYCNKKQIASQDSEAPLGTDLERAKNDDGTAAHLIAKKEATT